MSAKVYVEGGGGRALNAKCREAFKSFFEAAGLRGRLPREAWFLADREALRAVFGRDFRPAALPQRAEIEQIAKQDVLTGLANAAHDCGGRRGYKKGRDSFDVVAALDPAKVTAASPHAKRLVDVLLAKLQPPRARRAW